MSDDPSPTLRRRELGAHLRRLRKARGWTTKDVADRLGFSVSKVSRMETGARGVNARDVAALVQVFGLDDELAAHLSAIARTGKRRNENRSAIVVDTDYIGIQDAGFVDLEGDAAGIREYNSSIIPGLLQCEAYMRPAMTGSAPDVSLKLIEMAVASRIDRQRILSKSPLPTFQVIVDEAALRRRVGDRGVMREQLQFLGDLVARGVVELAVIPFHAGSHPGLNSDFVALHIEEPALLDVVFVEGLAGHLRFDRQGDVERYQRVWGKLREVALPPEATPSILSVLADDLWAPLPDAPRRL